MIITVVCDVLGEENNGTTIAAKNLIRYLKSRGHTVRVLSTDENGTEKENNFVVPSRSFGKLLNHYIEKVGVKLAKPIEETVRASLEGADAVHIILPFALGKVAVKIAKEQGLPVTAGFHMQAENFTSYIKLNRVKMLNKGVYKYIYHGFYKDVDAIHYPTEFIRSVFERNIKKKTNGYVISNGVHAYVKRRTAVKPDEYKDKIVILTTGRFAREKSQDTLIKAVKKSKYSDQIQLILGGQGLKEKKYQKLAKGLKNQPVFKFFARNDIIDVLNYADLYVHPADIELEGISCIEAIACGKMTIVSDSKLSATKYFAVDDKCIFHRRSVKDLTRVIDYWIEHPIERKEYEEKYLSSAIAYDQDECMKKMEEMIYGVKSEKEKTKEDILLR